MRVVCLGGGPAGLYFAISLKLRNPTAEISVLERNKPDDTFGWGVVLSDETLSNLHSNDETSASEIRANFAYWDDISVTIKQQCITSGGHGFCGIGRKKLLSILQNRARELGISLQFETEIDSAQSYADEYDLVIAADGLNSRTRGELAGWVWAHAYQFDDDTATFIVETDHATFDAFGFADMSQQQSIAVCEEIFQDHLDGHPLMTNANHIRGSAWINFPRVLCERWSYNNIVLMGDAAATAHFSIGSGTKLALESAIALAELVSVEPTLEQAFAQYEDARRLEVLRLQSAARNSLEWFEDIHRYLDMDPVQFTYSLLTRSQRISHENLRVRDAKWLESAEKWFQSQAGATTDGTSQGQSGQAGSEQTDKPRAPMFAPYQLRDLRLKNRIVVSPMAQYKAIDGCPTDWHFVHYAERAKGGAGLVYTENNWPLLSASAIPWSDNNAVPKAMTRDDMDTVKAQFVSSVEMAARCNFDMIELHAAHGYLISSFISPLSNQRDDNYGGSLQNRLRFPLEVFAAMRKAWPKQKPLSVRISASDWVDSDGVTPEQAVAIAQAFVSAGADIIDVSAGQTSIDASPVYGRMFQTPFSDRIRNEAGVATMAVGNIYEADHVNSILMAGRADLVCLARPHLNDPYWTLHTATDIGDRQEQWPLPYLAGRDQAWRQSDRKLAETAAADTEST